MQEIWKPIKHFKKTYEISNFGNIRKVNNQALLPIYTNKDGYAFVVLSNQKNRWFIIIHQLVWDTFGDKSRKLNGKAYCDIDHIDNNKTNNRIDNLQLLSHKANIKKIKRKKKPLPEGIKKMKGKYFILVLIGKRSYWVGGFSDKRTAIKRREKVLAGELWCR